MAKKLIKQDGGKHGRVVLYNDQNSTKDFWTVECKDGSKVKFKETFTFDETTAMHRAYKKCLTARKLGV